MSHIAFTALVRPRMRGAVGATMLGMIVFAMLALGASSASAIVTQLSNGARVSYQPLPGAKGTAKAKQFSASGPPLLYWGGPVMSSNTNYVIYWDPKGAEKYAKKFTGGVNKYFKDIAHDSGLSTNTESILTQYGGNYVSAFGGKIKDNDPLPANGCNKAPICLTDEQLRAEVKKVVESRGLPQDLNHEYFLFTAPNVESCFESPGAACSANSSAPAYCAYHGVIGGSGGPIVWSNDPYVFEKVCDEPAAHPNGPSDSALLGGLSHEHSESVTDPELNAWFNEFGEEIGDICRTFELESEFGTIHIGSNGKPYNQVINKHHYLYQQEWSNAGNACQQHI